MAAGKPQSHTTVVHVLLILLAALVLFALVAYYNRNKAPERFNASQQQQQRRQQRGPSPAVEQGAASDSASFPGTGNSVGSQRYREAGATSDADGVAVRDAFPQDTLSPEDLLPKDAANSRWAQTNPAGTGDVKDQNFLTAGYHLGMDTIGQSLRNASHDIRSAPPNPQYKVSIWQQSTITPDLNRRPLE